MAYELYSDEDARTLRDLARAVTEIDAAYPEYELAKKYYDGDATLGFQSQELVKLLSKKDDHFTINYAAIPVNTVSDRLQLSGVQAGDATDAVSTIWESNSLNLTWGQFVRDTLIYGDNYLVAWPGADDAEDIIVDTSGEMNLDAPLVELTAADPLTTRMFYDYRGKPEFAARKWVEKTADGKKICRVNLYYTDRIEKYFRAETSKKEIDFAPFIEDGEDVSSWPLVHDFGTIPIFHFRTEGPYGTPEHKAVFGVQDALNKIFQVHISSIEFLGFPIIYALLDPTSAAGTSDFEYGPVDNTEPVTAPTALKSAPGELLALRATNVGQFKPAGSEDFLRSLGTYKEIAAEISGIPARYFVSSGGQHPSADSINAADAALRQRILDRELQIGYALASVIVFALQLAGIEVSAKDISVLWVPQKLQITKDLIQEMEFKRGLGVPDYQILLELGYSDAQIVAWGIAPLETSTPTEMVQTPKAE